MSNIPIHERSKWVGASESAALLGVSPFTTKFELFHQKSGSIARPDLDASDRIQAGKFLEPAIAAWAAHRWSWPLAKVSDYLVHPHVRRMGASLDFEAADGSPIEIKNVDRSIFREKWVAEGDDLVDAPVEYLVQVMHQLACRPAAARGWLVACVGGNTIYRMPVERHPGLIARIEAAVTEFWDSVDAGTPPRPDFGEDGEAIAALFRRGDGSTADLSVNNRAPVVFAEFLAAKAEADAADDRKKAAMAEIREMIGAASRVIAPAGYQLSIADIAAIVTKPSVRQAYRRISIKGV